MNDAARGTAGPDAGSPDEPSEPSAASARRWLLAILALAALLRLATLASLRHAPFVAQLAMDSQEYDRWARSIAEGDWLGREPFFQAPLYPYAIAAIYRFVAATPFAVYLFQIAFDVAGLWALARAGRAMVDRRTGLAAAALGALYVPAWFHDVQLLKEGPALATTGFLLWALASARRGGRARGWLGAGAVAGVLTLLRENLLVGLPALAALPFLRPRAARPASSAAAFLLGAALVFAPVALRNAALGGGLLPTTWQGGVNFWIGNQPAADGTYRSLVPGQQIPRLERQAATRLAEQAAGRRLTGAEVSRFWLGRSLAWARAEPLAFLRLQLVKLRLFFSFYEWPDAVDYYWMKQRSWVLGLPGFEWGSALLLAALGLAVARRRLPALAPALLLSAVWIATTVAFFLFARYRLPMASALAILGAAPLVEIRSRWRAAAADPDGRRRALLLVLVVLVAWAAPQVLRYRPRPVLVEYNLGRLAEERGEPALAETHYRAALAADPHQLLALLNLGRLAAARGDRAAAREDFERAVASAPDSPDAAANLGVELLLEGDAAGAARALDRALEIDDRHVSALHNRVVAALAAGDVAGARRFLARLENLAPDDPATVALAARVARAAGR
jgi:tetratricopeptide (TPR) repeat protein